MSTISYAHPAAVMIDGTKGSLTNRAECAKEHFKNNFKKHLTYSAIGATTATALLMPKTTNKVAKFIGKGFGNILSHLGSKIANSKIAQSIIKNPTKAGKYALIATGLGIVLKTIQDHAYTAGQIDQKYTDSAAIESQTKRIVLA